MKLGGGGWVVAEVVAGIVAVVVPRAHAQCLAHETARLSDLQGEAGDAFGRSVAISGDVALIGAPYDDGGTHAGSASIYRFDGSEWVEEVRIPNPDPDRFSHWGFAVALDGDTAVIGSGWTSQTVVVYEFDGSSWVRIADLMPSREAFTFGSESIAISGDTIMVGAPRDSEIVVEGGEAFVFNRPAGGWADATEDAILTAPVPREDDWFGHSISLRSGRAIIGAPQTLNSFPDEYPGRAFVFELDGGLWQATAELAGSAGYSDDWFGSAVSLNGDACAIGAIGLRGEESVYVFRFTGAHWEEEQRLRSGVPDAAFWGYSVALSGDLVAAGWLWGGPQDMYSGAVEVFRFDGASWGHELEWQPRFAEYGTSLGSSMSVSGDRLLAGAPAMDDSGEVLGRAYVLDLGAALADCQGDGIPDACNIASGGSADCNANGVPDECDPVPPPVEDGELIGATTSANDTLGIAVASSGEVAVLGADHDDDMGDDAGAAYIFRRGGAGWAEEAKLYASNPSSFDAFGGSVGASGDIAVVGAYTGSHNGIASGAVHVFRFNGAAWSEEARLGPSDAQVNDQFGTSVAASGVRLIGGAPRYSQQRGAAYIFRHDGEGWTEEAKLVASDPGASERFGQSVAIRGDLAIAGAPYDGATKAGAAYIFRWNGAEWSEEAKLIAPDGAAFDYLGWSVAIADGVALVGALRGTTDGSPAGAAYVYRYDGAVWNFEQKLVADSGQALAWFGCSVSISADLALIGSYEQDNGQVRQGAAYLFRHTGGGWAREHKIIASDGAQSDWFGFSVALGAHAIVGAPNHDDAGDHAGAAYAFDYDHGPPRITHHPADRTVDEGERVQFAVAAAGGAPLWYAWEKDGEPLADGDRVTGASTPLLVIDPTVVLDSGSYACIVGSACDAVASNPATLTVAPACPADFDGDGLVDTRDVLAFLNAWAADEPAADFNGDGTIDTRDVLAFLGAWSAGC